MSDQSTVQDVSSFATPVQSAATNDVSSFATPVQQPQDVSSFAKPVAQPPAPQTELQQQPRAVQVAGSGLRGALANVTDFAARNIVDPVERLVGDPDKPGPLSERMKAYAAGEKKEIASVEPPHSIAGKLVQAGAGMIPALATGGAGGAATLMAAQSADSTRDQMRNAVAQHSQLAGLTPEETKQKVDSAGDIGEAVGFITGGLLGKFGSAGRVLGRVGGGAVSTSVTKTLLGDVASQTLFGAGQQIVDMQLQKELANSGGLDSPGAWQSVAENALVNTILSFGLGTATLKQTVNAVRAHAMETAGFDKQTATKIAPDKDAFHAAMLQKQAGIDDATIRDYADAKTPEAKQAILDAHDAKRASTISDSTGTAPESQTPAVATGNPAQSEQSQRPIENAGTFSHPNQPAVDAIAEKIGGGSKLQAVDRPTGEREGEAKAVDALASAVGKKVLWVKRTEGVNFGGTVDGDHIVVNADSPNAYHGIFTHEVMHQMETDAPDLHAQLMDAAKQIPEFTKAFDELKSHYDAQGVKPPEGDGLWKEVIADTMQKKGTDEGFWRQVMDKAPDAVRKIIETIKNIVAKLSNKSVPRDVEKIVGDLQSFHDTAAKVMAEYIERKNEPQRESLKGTHDVSAGDVLVDKNGYMHRVTYRASKGDFFTTEDKNGTKTTNYKASGWQKATQEEIAAMPKDERTKVKVGAAEEWRKPVQENQNASDVRSNQKQIGERGDAVEAGGNARGADLQRQESEKASDEQKGLTSPELERLHGERDQIVKEARREMFYNEKWERDPRSKGKQSQASLPRWDDLQARIEKNHDQIAHERERLGLPPEDETPPEGAAPHESELPFSAENRSHVEKKLESDKLTDEERASLEARKQKAIVRIKEDDKGNLMPERVRKESVAVARAHEWISARGIESAREILSRPGDPEGLRETEDTAGVAHKARDILIGHFNDLADKAKTDDEKLSLYTKRELLTRADDLSGTMAGRSLQARSKDANEHEALGNQMAHIARLEELQAQSLKLDGSLREHVEAIPKEVAPVVEKAVAESFKENERLKAMLEKETTRRKSAESESQRQSDLRQALVESYARKLPNADEIKARLIARFGAKKESAMPLSVEDETVKSDKDAFRDLVDYSAQWLAKNPKADTAQLNGHLESFLDKKALADLGTKEIFKEAQQRADYETKMVRFQRAQGPKPETPEQTVRRLGEDPIQIAKDHFAGRNAEKNLAQKLFDSGMSKEDAARMAGELTRQMAQKLNEAQTKKLMRQAVVATGTKGPAADSLVDNVNAHVLSGALDNKTALEAFKKAHGLQELDAATMARLKANAEAVKQAREKLKPGDFRILDAEQKSKNFIASLIKSGNENIITNQMYQNVLDAPHVYAFHVLTRAAAVVDHFATELAQHAVEGIGGAAKAKTFAEQSQNIHNTFGKMLVTMDSAKFGMRHGLVEAWNQLTKGYNSYDANFVDEISTKALASNLGFEQISIENRNKVLKAYILAARMWGRAVFADNILGRTAISDEHSAILTANELIKGGFSGNARELARAVSEKLGRNSENVRALMDEAKTMGLTGHDARRYMQEMIRTRDTAANDIGAQFARGATLQGSPDNGVLGILHTAVASLGNKFHILKPLTLLSGIGPKVVGYWMDHSPFALFQATSGYSSLGDSIAASFHKMAGKDYTPRLGERLGTRERTTAAIRATTSTALATLAYAYAKASMTAYNNLPDDEKLKQGHPYFSFNGNGPADARQNIEWRKQGNKPWTMRFGSGPQINYLLTPLAIPLAFAAVLSDRERYNESSHDDFDTRAMAGAMITSAMMTEEIPGMRLIEPIAAAKFYKEGNVEGAEREFNKFVGSYIQVLIPTLLREAAGYRDAKQYEAHGLKEAILLNIPFARGAYLQPQVNYTGDEIGHHTFDRIAHNPQDNKAAWFLINHKLPMPIPSRKQQYFFHNENSQTPRLLTEKEYHDLFVATQKDFIAHVEKRLGDLSGMKSSDYQREWIFHQHRESQRMAEQKILGGVSHFTPAEQKRERIREEENE